MAYGIYVHVPFCRSICPYCAFNVRKAPAALAEQQNALAQCIVAQFQAQKHLFSGPVRTVYFGGGTPSLMTPAFFAHVLDALRQHHTLVAHAEITVECEPNTVSQNELAAWRAMGINRLSIGWQSQSDATLRLLGRGHTAAQARDTYAHARAAGFDNVSLDLLCAVPGQSLASLHADVEAIVQAAPEHVSCYGLTIEPRTPFAQRVAHGRLTPMDDDAQADALILIARRLRQAGYGRYEVSSFARPNKQSQHNRAYWTGRPYLGLGPGAHSFAHRSWQHPMRWQSEPRLPAYLRAYRAPRAAPGGVEAFRYAHLEVLGPIDLARERVLVGMRRCAGLSLLEKPLRPFVAAIRRAAETLCVQRLCRYQGHRLCPTARGLLQADHVAGQLLAEI